MKKFAALITVIVAVSFLSGCGETVTGMVKDTKRIGGGVKKIFVRE